MISDSRKRLLHSQRTSHLPLLCKAAQDISAEACEDPHLFAQVAMPKAAAEVTQEPGSAASAATKASATASKQSSQPTAAELAAKAAAEATKLAKEKAWTGRCL